MTQDQIILAVVSAAVGVAAKGFFEWILTIVSKLSVVENFKEKLKTIFTKQNISISIDFISGLFFIGYSCPSRQKGKISLEMALLPLEVPCSKRLDLQIERPRH